MKTKYEVETAILKEFDEFFPTIKNMKFDKALPILQQNAWKLADKYDTDGTNVMNIVLSRFKELNNG